QQQPPARGDGNLRQGHRAFDGLVIGLFLRIEMAPETELGKPGPGVRGAGAPRLKSGDEFISAPRKPGPGVRGAGAPRLDSGAEFTSAPREKGGSPDAREN